MDIQKSQMSVLTRLQYMLRTSEKNAFLTLENNGVKWKTHPQYPNLYQFRYDMIKAKFQNKEVRECRGIILDKDNSWEIVAFPFTKFFNLGEFYAADIDWSTAKIVEKLDGTMCMLYYYNGWQVATQGMPDAGGNLDNNSSKTFAELFWEVWNLNNYSLPDNTSCTYVFELMSIENKVVVRVTSPKLVLTGVRNIRNGVEKDPEIVAKRYGYESATRYDIPTTPEDVTSLVSKMNAGAVVDQEGVICVDASFNRLKVKNDKYQIMNHLKGGFSMARLMGVVKSNEGSEFLTQFPERKEKFDVLEARYKALVTEVNSLWEANKNIACRKTFARAVSGSRAASILFLLKDGKLSSVEEGFSSFDDKRLLEILKVPNESIW